MNQNRETPAEYAERLCRTYFQDIDRDRKKRPKGKCAKCEYLQFEYEDGKDLYDMYWCVLAHGAYRDQDCDKCPGIQGRLAVKPVTVTRGASTH